MFTDRQNAIGRCCIAQGAILASSVTRHPHRVCLTAHGKESGHLPCCTRMRHTPHKLTRRSAGELVEEAQPSYPRILQPDHHNLAFFTSCRPLHLCKPLGFLGHCGRGRRSLLIVEIFGSELSVLTRTPTQGRVAKMPAAAVKGELQCTNMTI